jgi:hypothetical protein
LASSFKKAEKIVETKTPQVSTAEIKEAKGNYGRKRW